MVCAAGRLLGLGADWSALQRNRKRPGQAGQEWLCLRDQAFVPVPVVSRSRGFSAMGTVWSALLVGGGLAGALLVWLLRDGPGEPGKDADAEQQENTPLGEAAAPEGDQGGGGGGPSKRDSVTKPGILSPRVSRADRPGVFEVHRGGFPGVRPRGRASTTGDRTLLTSLVFPGWC